MKTFKIILGALFSFGLLFGGLPTFFEDISNGAAGAVIFGELIGITLIGALIYYLFASATKKNETTDLNS